ncbi:MAG TPA: DUF5063 domain-containing protein [Phycisphaerae bacterium]|nr:DUF5063 domain-containing protein [Phycisphaerae bacterium]
MPISEANLSALSAFAALAEEYCTFIESLRSGRPARLYGTLEELLARIHLGILPVEIEMPEKEHRRFQKVRMTDDQYSEAARMIGEAVGKESAALATWHDELRPSDQTGDDYCATRAFMLWDDLADIYRDLHNGVALWKLDTPDALAEAAWEWRFGYESHWGNHLFRAMATVHEARYHEFAD